MWGGILSTLPSFMHSSDISTSLPVECSTVALVRKALTMWTMNRDHYHNTLPLSTCCPATLPVLATSFGTSHTSTAFA